MAIKTECQHCGEGYSLADTQKGKLVRCKTCGETFEVHLLRGDESELAGSAALTRRFVEDSDEEDSPRPGQAKRSRPIRHRPRDEEDEHPKDSSSAMPMFVAAAGAFILFGCLVAMGLGVYFVFFQWNWRGVLASGRPNNAGQVARPGNPNFNQPPPNFNPPRNNPGFNPPPAPNVSEFDANLNTIKTNPNRFAVMYFTRQPVNPARKVEVARALESCLQAPDKWIGYDACDALKKWGDKESVKPLVAFFFAVTDDPIRTRTIQALGEIKDPASAKALISLLKAKAGHTAQINEALRRVGSVGEQDVAALLNEPDPDLQIEGCRVLASIGTRASLPALQQILNMNAPAARTRPGRLYKAADEAVRAIQVRGS
jgi:hypothetical protein